MVSCSVRGCRSSFTKTRLKFFTFPRDVHRCEIWKAFTKRDYNLLPKYPRICEVHFDESQFELKRQDGWRKLKWSAVPTLFPPLPSSSECRLNRKCKQKSVAEEQLVTSLKLTGGEELHNSTSMISSEHSGNMVAGKDPNDHQVSEARTSSRKQGRFGVNRETGIHVIRDRKVLQSLLGAIAETIQRVSWRLQETTDKKRQLMQAVNSLTQEEILLQKQLKKESDKENALKQHLREVENTEQQKAEEVCGKELDNLNRQVHHQHMEKENWNSEEQSSKGLGEFLEKDSQHCLQIARQTENDLNTKNFLRETSAAMQPQIELKLIDCFVLLTSVDDVRFVTLNLNNDADTNKISDSNPGLVQSSTVPTVSCDIAKADDVTTIAESLAEKTHSNCNGFDNSNQATCKIACVETGSVNEPSFSQHLKYVCSFCGERFWNAGARLSHELKHGTEFRCNVCNKVFSNRWGLINHKRTHSNEKRFGCTHCDRHFKTKGSCNRHFRSHTLTVSCDVAQADDVTKVAESLAAKTDRVECDGLDHSNQTTCKIACDKTGSHSDPSLLLHLKHICSFCGESFWNAGARHSHELKHGMEFRCNVCDKVFSYRTGLMNHKLTHLNEKPFGCTHCDRHFKTNGSRIRHFRSHTREKHFACSVCSETFFYAYQRAVHMSVHTGRHPYLCQDCGRGFATRSCLSRHMRIHSGEKPFECDVCGKRFRQVNQVKAHKEMHGEKPRVCSHCGKRLGMGSYWTHMKQHKQCSGIRIYYECAVCDKKLTTKTTLEMHTRMVHMGEAPYVCKICYMQFGKFKDFQLHKKEHNQCSS